MTLNPFLSRENIHDNMETENGHSIQVHGWNHNNILYMKTDTINDIENTKDIILNYSIMPTYYRFHMVKITILENYSK